jgi:hypothetical protein
MKKPMTAMILGSTLLTACVTAPGPGAQEGATPPRLVMQDNKVSWSNAGSFGPVPAAKATMAAQNCASLNTMDAKFVATGYHSQAQDLNGKVLPNGGYYCVRQ